MPGYMGYTASHNKDGSVTFGYTPVLPGTYKITVQYNGEIPEGGELSCLIEEAEGGFITAYGLGNMIDSDTVHAGAEVTVHRPEPPSPDAEDDLQSPTIAQEQDDQKEMQETGIDISPVVGFNTQEGPAISMEDQESALLSITGQDQGEGAMEIPDDDHDLAGFDDAGDNASQAQVIGGDVTKIKQELLEGMLTLNSSDTVINIIPDEENMDSTMHKTADTASNLAKTKTSIDSNPKSNVKLSAQRNSQDMASQITEAQTVPGTPKRNHITSSTINPIANSPLIETKAGILTRSRSPRRPSDFICIVAGCGRAFPSKDKLVRHQKVHREIVYACTQPKCNKKFTETLNYNVHLQRIHGFTADEAGNILEGKSEDIDELEWEQCDLCGAVCQDKRKFRRHARVHMDKRPFSCRKCKKNFKLETTLRNHMAVHGEGKSVCHVCNKYFMEKAKFDIHIALHDEDKDTTSCNKCHVKFSIHQDLSSHKCSEGSSTESPSIDVDSAAENSDTSTEMERVSEVSVNENCGISSPRSKRARGRPKGSTKDKDTDNLEPDIATTDNDCNKTRGRPKSSTKKIQNVEFEITSTKISLALSGKSTDPSFEISNETLLAQLTSKVPRVELKRIKTEIEEANVQKEPEPIDMEAIDALISTSNMLLNEDNSDLENEEKVDHVDLEIPSIPFTNEEKVKQECTHPWCNRKFLNQSSLEAHLTRIHGLSDEEIDRLLQRGEIEFVEGKQAKCKDCGVTCLDEEKLQRHSVIHGENRPFICSKCPRTFKTKGVLMNHMAIHGEGKFHCEVCDKYFPNKTKWDRHTATHVDSSSCKRCLHEYGLDEDKSLHVCDENKVINKKRVKRSRDPTKEGFTCMAEGCGRQFATKGMLCTHINREHACNAAALGHHRAFICEVCGKVFGNKFKLWRHSAMHSEDRPFMCDICGNSFKAKEALLVHLREIHGPNAKTKKPKVDPSDPLICKYCGKSFSRKVRLNYHVAAHESDERYPCERCDKIFPTKFKVKEHMRMVHPAVEHRIVCPYEGCSKVLKGFNSYAVHRNIHENLRWGCMEESCGLHFSTKHTMLMHYDRVHRNIEPCIPCPYEGCGKMFKSKGNVHQHIATHRTTRSFPCDLCGKSFKTKNTLRRHARIHSAECHVSCTFCDKTFTRKERLREHMLKHKEIVILPDAVEPHIVEQITQVVEHVPNDLVVDEKPQLVEHVIEGIEHIEQIPQVVEQILHGVEHVHVIEQVPVEMVDQVPTNIEIVDQVPVEIVDHVEGIPQAIEYIE